MAGVLRTWIVPGPNVFIAIMCAGVQGCGGGKRVHPHMATSPVSSQEKTPLFYMESLSKNNNFSCQSMAFTNVFIAVVCASVLGLPYTRFQEGRMMGSVVGGGWWVVGGGWWVVGGGQR
ncbi:hypothetical protein Vadar_005255 [Vaccinium darrowii]|uniref:Uncharacterized protein n=1 Tax=Vaccinium darrowii TaxID=229202 RepID=A0ACB7XWQ7_9ERIC|nr:hypothetical protein Vadar_005255 [Vaccinium darrowii]